jgi:hypothetical protein
MALNLCRYWCFEYNSDKTKPFGERNIFNSVIYNILVGVACIIGFCVSFGLVTLIMSIISGIIYGLLLKSDVCNFVKGGVNVTECFNTSMMAFFWYMFNLIMSALSVGPYVVLIFFAICVGFDNKYIRCVLITIFSLFTAILNLFMIPSFGAIVSHYSSYEHVKEKCNFSSLPKLLNSDCSTEGLLISIVIIVINFVLLGLIYGVWKCHAYCKQVKKSQNVSEETLTIISNEA